MLPADLSGMAGVELQPTSGQRLTGKVRLTAASQSRLPPRAIPITETNAPASRG
jgi:hypothetical protein